jgi:hypothetical protein
MFFRSYCLEISETFLEAQLGEGQYEGRDRTSCLGKDFTQEYWEVVRTYLILNFWNFPCHEHELHFSIDKTSQKSCFLFLAWQS